jgi:tetratricopeptide (TPR) repeat protein
MDSSTLVLIAVLVGYAAWNLLIRRWYKLAAENYKAGNYSEAAKAYSKILFVQRSNFHAYHWRAECNIKLEKFQEAIADYDKMIYMQSANIPAYLDRSRVFALQNNFEKAFQDIDIALSFDPENFRSFLSRALIYRQRKDHDRAIIEYNRAIALIERDIERTKKGMPYASDEKHIEFLERNLGWAYQYRAEIFIEKSEFDAALADYDQCIKLDYHTADMYVNRAVTLHRKGDRQAALLDYNRALDRDPGNITAFLNRGIAKMELREFSSAILDFSDVIKLNSQNWVAYNNRAEGYFALRQYDDAMSDFQKAEAVEAGQKIVQAGLAVTLDAMGKVDEAKRLWQALITTNVQYRDIDWVQRKLRWSEPLVDEARKLIATLDQPE